MGVECFYPHSFLYSLLSTRMFRKAVLLICNPLPRNGKEYQENVVRNEEMKNAHFPRFFYIFLNFRKIFVLFLGVL